MLAQTSTWWDSRRRKSNRKWMINLVKKTTILILKKSIWIKNHISPDFISLKHQLPTVFYLKIQLIDMILIQMYNTFSLVKKAHYWHLCIALRKWQTANAHLYIKAAIPITKTSNANVRLSIGNVAFGNRKIYCSFYVVDNFMELTDRLYANILKS